MGTTELLRYLEKLEIGLSSFSYEELNANEASELKKSFNEFKNGLEDKVFGVPPMNELEVVFEEVGIQSAPSTDFSLLDGLAGLGSIATLIERLESTHLNSIQQDLLYQMKKEVELLEGIRGFFNKQQYATLIEKRLDVQRKSKVDLSSLWEECMHQRDLLEELVRLFKQNVLEFIGKVKVNLQNKNFRDIDFSCQKLGSSLRMLKTMGLLEITEQMSLVCTTDKDLKHLKFLYGQFLVEFPKVEELLNMEMEMLRKKNE